MLTRFLQPLPIGTARRTYSFFSSKPGGGRYFNSAKPHKVAPAAATATSTTKTKAKSDEGSHPSAPSSTSDDVPAKTLGQEDPSSTASSQSQSSPFSSRPIPSIPHLPPHPTFSGHTYPLHHFFSLHRPLLLLPLATPTLFETPSTSFDQATSPSPPEVSTSPFDETSEISTDADADAARQLARALALNRVGGWIDWEDTLARLGNTNTAGPFALEPSCSVDGPASGVSMESTKRKKRKKMSKHKYKKRRRLQRAERRKLGK